MSAARAARPTPGLVLGAEPRANLLPPEVHERVKARRTRGYLILAVVASLIATIGVYAFASIQAITAQAELAAAQTRTAELLQEKATYSDVISATNAISLIETIQGQATSTEVMWGEFLLDKVVPALPGTALWINRMTLSAPPPWGAPLEVVGPLRNPRVGNVELRLWTPTAPDATSIYRAFQSIDGVADVSIDLVEVVDEPSGFATTITMNLDESFFSDRWSKTAEEDDDEG